MTKKVIAGVYSGVTTVQLDQLAAETAASFTTKHPDYAILAARIAVSNLHKQTLKVFSGALSAPVAPNERPHAMTAANGRYTRRRSRHPPPRCPVPSSLQRSLRPCTTTSTPARATRRLSSPTRRTPLS